MPIVTIPELEEYGQVDFLNNSDPAVQRLIDWASAQVERFCNRTFEEEVGRVDTLDGTGQRSLWVPKFPVTAVASVVEDGDTLVVDSEFTWNAQGRFTRIRGKYNWVWTHLPRSVVITYTAGYADVDMPEEVKGVVQNIALRRFKSEAAWAAKPVGAAGDKQSVNLDGVGTITYSPRSGASRPWDPSSQADQQSAGSGVGLTPGEKESLAPYRRTTFGGATTPASRF